MCLKRPKKVPNRLESKEYRLLRAHILRRDGWKCQNCGSIMNLEVHHQEFRSHSGQDTDGNLITLCTRCHSSVHSL